MDEVEYPPLRCPIDSCEWTLVMPRVAIYKRFGDIAALAEVLAHVTGRRVDAGAPGYPQERTHTFDEISALTMEQILDAAQVESAVHA